MNVQVLNAPMIYGGLFASMAAGYYMYKNGMRKLNIEVSTGSLKKYCIDTKLKRLSGGSFFHLQGICPKLLTSTDPYS